MIVCCSYGIRFSVQFNFQILFLKGMTCSTKNSKQCLHCIHSSRLISNMYLGVKNYLKLYSLKEF